MAARKTRTNYLFHILTAVIVAAGVVFWATDLTSDPPSYFDGQGQSLATDPAQYVYHARNKILFDDWDPFDYPRWTVYQHSLTSAVGYLVFLIGGVSRPSAAIAGMVLCLGGLILLLLALHRFHRPWVLTAVTFCFMANVTLFTYGRLAYLENGLIFLVAALFFVWSRFGDRIWGLIVAGTVAALATFMGKLFGALLLPALLLAVFFSGDPRRWRRLAVAAGSYAVSAVALVVVLYGNNLAAAFSYVGEQSYRLRGFPEGLSTPWGFIEHLVAYGYKMRLYYLNPDILLFIVAGGSLLVLVRQPHTGKSMLSGMSRPLQLAVFWVAAAWVGLAPLTYSPIRYTLLLIPAAILMMVLAFDHLMADKKTPLNLGWPGWGGMTVLSLLWWTLAYHSVANLFFFNLPSPPVAKIAWMTLPTVAIVTLTGRFFLRKAPRPFSRRWLLVTLVALLAISAVVNGFRIRRTHFLDHAFTIKEAGEDLREIIGENAVISGPYGPELAMESGLKSFIHLFGVANIDSSLFDRYPITHLAIDVSNAEEAVRQYPPIGLLSPITTYYLRDVEVQVYNIAHAFGNPDANRYRPSHYERAIQYYVAKQFDSASLEIQEHLTTHPPTRSITLLIGDMLWQSGQYEAAMAHMMQAAETYRTDWNVQLQTARMIQVVAIMQQSNYMLAKSREYYERAAFANRYRGMEAQQSYYDLMKKAGQPTGTPANAPEP